jgi:transcriptional regulator with XRE-family HTH domain
MATLGERIRQRSREMGWTVSQLDEVARLADETVARLEPGDEQLTAADLLQVGRVLGLSLDYLMTRRTDVPAPLHVSVPRSLAKLSATMRLSRSHELALLELHVRILSPRPVKPRTMLE